MSSKFKSAFFTIYLDRILLYNKLDNGLEIVIIEGLAYNDRIIIWGGDNILSEYSLPFDTNVKEYMDNIVNKYKNKKNDYRNYMEA